MKKKWNSISVSKKLFAILGVMIFFVTFELYILFFSFENLVSVRALIVGEGLWTKAQKDAVHSLYQYAYSHDPVHIKNFNQYLQVIDGDRLARIELSNDNINLMVVRNGFLKGKIQPNEIDGIIRLLLKSKNSKYIQQAFAAWSKADELILELKKTAYELQLFSNDQQKLQKLLIHIGYLNDELTFLEKNFSESLISGSRFIEELLKVFLSFLVILFEGFAIYIVYRFGSYLVNTLNDLKYTANEVGKGNFQILAPEKYTDELGQLGLSINKMIKSLKTATDMQKNIEESLRRSNERFLIMVNALKDYAIYSLDLQGCVLTWNSGAEHVQGYAATEVIGKHFSIFYSEEERSADAMNKELFIASQFGCYERETLCIKKDGTKFWANITINAAYNSEGEVASYTQVTRDITERKEHEIILKKNNSELEKRIDFRTKELQWRESQLRQITNALPESVCQLDFQQKFLFVNESFCQLLNLKKNDIVGKSMIEILGRKCYLIIKNRIIKVLSGELVNFDFNFKINDIDIIHNITLVPDFNDMNNVSGFILVAHDIKKYKEIEFELKRAKELAEVANETKSAFLANMSHEIRTPLGAVLGFSEIILNNEISEAQKTSIVDAIKRNGQLLSNVINDILDLSKVEAGKLEIEKVEISFIEIINDIKSLLALKASEKGILLSIILDECIPAIIKTDPLRLRQILLNIIGNAIKFTQQGEVEVKIKLVNQYKCKTSKLAFIIRDTGSGMTNSQAEKLFIPFSQADVSTTRKFGGSGLGLALSKKLAQALGGDVVLDKTEPEVGSVFIVTIDTGLLASSAIEKFELNKTIDFVEAKEDVIFDFRQFKVLLVEDSLDNQFIISHFLKATGVVLKVANNGQEGVELALSEHFDLVLLDLQMPVMGGLEAIKILIESGYQSPVIALTAHAMKEDRKQCLNAGFKDHLSKPVNRNALLKTINYWIKNKNIINKETVEI